MNTSQKCVVRVKLLGRQPDQWRPFQSYFFVLWSVIRFHVVGTAGNDRRSLRNTFGWMGTLQAPLPPPSSSMAESWWRPRGIAPWKLQRICIFRYLNLGLNIAQQYVDGYAFFSCALQYKVTGKSQKSKIFNSRFSYSKKSVCSLALAG